MRTVLGVDLGGTKILIGELTLTGEVLSQKSYTSIGCFTKRCNSMH